MKTSTILAFLAGSIATTFAVPAPAPAPAAAPAPAPAPIAAAEVTKYEDGLPTELIPRSAGLEKRANAGVYLCVDNNFSGYCVHIVQPLYQCINLSGDLNDKVSSLGPDKPYYCLFYRGKGGLRKQQRIEAIRKEFEKSPENPFNQVSARFDSTKEEIREITEVERTKIEARLAG